MDIYPASSLGQVNTMNPTNTINSGYVVDLQQTSGMEGARNLKTTLNSRSVAFDSNDDVFYIIRTDMNGSKTINRYRFYEEPEPKPEDIFASKAEIRELKGEIDNVQQSIRELTAAVTTAIANGAAESNVQSDSGSAGNNKKFIPKSKGEGKPNGSFTGANV